MNNFSLAIHGGAGTLLKSQISQDQEKAYHEALNDALQAGYYVLKNAGEALEAVQVAVTHLEDSPLFNAGKGSVYTNEGKHELEASLMCGKSGQAGAVAGIETVRNPIALCRKILIDDEVVFLFGSGAEEYAREHDQLTVDPSYFATDFRKQQLQKAKEQGGRAILDHDSERKFGTVGAVAMDQHGNLAAGTSTGGLTNKKYGRVGDSSVIGSGCFADNQTCAISATGYGEYFLRNVTAHEISSLMKYANYELQKAADTVIHDQLKPMGGEGGVICVDARGNIVFSFNSEGMYRGSVDASGKIDTAIYG